MDISEAIDYTKNSVGVWANNLSLIIEGIRHRGKKPMLIALSRKMPRFMDWVIGTRADGSLSLNTVKVISGVDLTTELAVPFLFQSLDTNECEFIILDDIIIFGSTLRSIADTLYLLTGTKSHVSCILRRKDSGYIENVDQNELQMIPIADDKFVDSFVDSISTIVEQTQLPIDLEFPVFLIDDRIDNNDLRISQAIIEHSYQHGLMAYSVDANGERFSINLSDKHTIGSNTDFAKIRFFDKKQRKNSAQMVFEVISPMVFSQSELMSIDTDLFENKEYQRIWSKTTYGIRWIAKEYFREDELLKLEILKSNFVRSLCVWASYLYSLSVYIKNTVNILPRHIVNMVSLSLPDLVLVMGKAQAEAIYPILEALIEGEIVAESRKEKVFGLPKSFCPEPFENELLSNKILSGILADSVFEVFCEIFKYQHYSNPKFSNKYISRERPFFGETYDSLRETIQPYFDGGENVQRMYQWIDENIDLGFVVPKYELVRNKTGVVYWKRYFHPGIRRYKTKA